MRLGNHQEAENTRAKLALLEAHYEKARQREMETEEPRQLTLYSLRRSINDLKEELMRFEFDLESGRMKTHAAV